MKALITLLLFTFAVAASAQTTSKREKFDITSYEAPTGWTLEKQEKAVVFRRADPAGVMDPMIVLNASEPSLGDPKTDFAAAWKTRLPEGPIAEALPNAETSPFIAGWKLTGGQQPLHLELANGSKIDFFSYLAVFTDETRRVDALITSSDPQTGKIFQTFLASLRFDPPKGNAKSKGLVKKRGTRR
jgi:hypothetical protein